MADAPKKPPMTKDSLLPLLTAHVLAHGLGGASLRPLAKAAKAPSPSRRRRRRVSAKLKA